MSNSSISDAGEKSEPKHKFFTGKLQIRLKRSRFSRLLSKFLSYIGARERAEKSPRFISYIYSYALMYQACSYPNPILFPKYLAVPLYLIYCEFTDGKLEKKQEHIYGV